MDSWHNGLKNRQRPSVSGLIDEMETVTLQRILRWHVFVEKRIQSKRFTDFCNTVNAL